MSSHRGQNARDDWQTPPEVLDLVRKVGPIGLDPCTVASNPVKAEYHFTKETDGLWPNWRSSMHIGAIAFVNPPYNKTWYDKIELEMLRETPMIALLMAKPGAKWFQSLAVMSHAVCFWSGRMTFGGAPDPAPFDSALLYHGPHPGRFRAAFAGKGWLV